MKQKELIDKAVQLLTETPDEELPAVIAFLCRLGYPDPRETPPDRPAGPPAFD